MKLELNSDLFEYDVRGLLQAFFPWTKFETDECVSDRQCLSVLFSDTQGEPLNGEAAKEAETVLAAVRFTDDDREYHERVTLSMADRSRAKTTLKQVIYRILSENAGRELPWGTLTGIRPTKIAMGMLTEGAEDAEILRHMTGDLLVSKEKAELALDIAKREKPIIEISDEPGWSLYIGIPFCPSTCLYCSFTSFSIEAYQGKVEAYLEALHKELVYVSEAFRGQALHTVYFGGGTPTSLSAEQLDTLFGWVTELFDLSGVREWTVEAGRPDSITREKLMVMKKYPITRISVNPQTMHQKTLDLIGRRHTVTDVRETYKTARELRFDNINMDLILGLPGETAEDIRETLREIVKMAPDSVTIHSLAIKRSSRLNLNKDVYSAYRMENTDEMMREAGAMLREIDVHPYYLYRQKNMAGNQENVGYARPGKEGVYNVLIMEETETIVACGAGATTKYVRRDTGLITRAANVHDVNTYISNICEMIERKKELFKN